MPAAVAAAICLALSRPAADYDYDPPHLRDPAPRLPVSARSAAGFVPRGWTLERSLKGDLNHDGRIDLVAILKGADPTCIVRVPAAAEPMDTNPRLLLVAFGGPRGFTRHLANVAVIPRIDDPYMDDPLDTLTLRGDVVRLRLTLWRSMGGWTTYTSTLSFRWDGGRFRLIGFDRETLQRNSGQTQQISIDYLTRRARIVTGSMEDDDDRRTRWRSIAPRQPAALETIGDGLAFEPRLPGAD